MDYDQLIKNWHTKASDEDYFSKYVFEYLAFIAFLKKKKFTNLSGDRNAIQKLKQNEDIKNLYLKKFISDQNIQNAWQNIKNELDRVRLGNVSQNGEGVEEIKWWNYSGDQLPPDANINDKGVLRDLTDWGNMVEFWYSIRNNLFHGGKDPQDERDQILVENGYKTLSALMEMLLQEENL